MTNDNNFKNCNFRIVFIMHTAPVYDYTGKKVPEPVHKWINNNGETLGIWKEDWAHLFGNNLLNCYPNLVYEVWRPDYRADKIYKHKFKSGLIHLSLPANNVWLRRGATFKSYIYASSMEHLINEIIKSQPSDTVLLVPAKMTAFSTILFKKYYNKIPMLGVHFTNNSQLLNILKFTWNPFKLLHRILFYYQMNSHLKRVKNLSVPHWDGIDILRERFNIRVRFNQLGATNFNFWQREQTKEEARKDLKIEAAKIILFSSRIVPQYQIDKVIEIISEFRGKDFIVVFTSHGDGKYLKEVQLLTNKLGMTKHVLFTGYVSEKMLRKYIIACDVFCTMPIKSAGSGTAIKSFLMEKPVISTDTGLSAELLKKYNCGILVPSRDYGKWRTAFSLVIDQVPQDIKILERQVVLDLLNKETRLRSWMQTINDTIDDFHLRNKNPIKRSV